MSTPAQEMCRGYLRMLCKPQFVWENETEYLIEGIPFGDDEETHNCDAMGCGMCHVLMRIPKHTVKVGTR